MTTATSNLVATATTLVRKHSNRNLSTSIDHSESTRPQTASIWTVEAAYHTRLKLNLSTASA